MGNKRWLLGTCAGAMAITLGVGALSGVADAAAAPAAVTGPTSGVSYTAADAFGNVNPEGVATDWYFQYGATAHYGLDTALHAAGAGGETLAVSAPLADLVPGTLYHYRLVAASKEGTTVGGDRSFTTPASPPGVATGAATAVADTTAVLRGAVNPRGLATVAHFALGTTPSYTANTAARSAGAGVAPTAVAIRADRLAPDTTYHFALVATNADGSATGADAAFTTTGPAIVADGTPSSVTAGSAVLSGTVDPGGHPARWFFQYGVSTSYGATTPVKSAGDGLAPVPVAAAISGLAPGTEYHFRLVARNADGTTVAGDSVIATLGPTLTASSGSTTFGQSTTLNGSIPTGASNQSVTIFAQRATDPSFVGLTTVLTGSGGAYSFAVRPRIGTSYKALWDNAATPIVSVGVRPSVMLRISGSSAAVRVAAARSLANRLVRLQRLVHGRWRVVDSARLGRGSSVVMRPSTPAGARLRAWLTAFQAGPGYEQAVSGVHRLQG